MNNQLLAISAGQTGFVLPAPLRLYPRFRFSREARDFHDAYWERELKKHQDYIADQENYITESEKGLWKGLPGAAVWRGNALQRIADSERREDFVRDVLANTDNVTLPDWRKMQDMNYATLLFGMYCRNSTRQWIKDNNFLPDLDSYGWLAIGASIADVENELFALEFNHPKRTTRWYVGFSRYPKFYLGGCEAPLYADRWEWDKEVSFATFKAIMARYACIEERSMRFSNANTA